MMRQLWRELLCAHEWSHWTDPVPVLWPTVTHIPIARRRFRVCGRCRRVYQEGA